MLKKLSLISLLTLLLTMPAHAIPWHCFQNYITNGGFADSSAWTYTNGAYWESTLDDPCDPYFGYKIRAAALTVPYAKVSQTFTTSAASTLGWSMQFEIQTQSIAGATAWDELRILVEDLTTGQSEVFFVKGTQLTSTCQLVSFNLQKNYAGHVVRLSFNAQPFTQLDMYIDNVAFWGRIC